MSTEHEDKFANPEVKEEQVEQRQSDIISDDQVDLANFKTYKGHCHCGKFRYEITLPRIEKLNECNCSICFMNGLRGLIWFSVEGPERFKVVEGDEENDLTSYSFGRRYLEHKFCNECGTNLFARRPGFIGFNALSLEPMPEIEAIPYGPRPGKLGAQHRKPHYAPQNGEPMKWTKDEKPLEEGQVEYQGHCHCGSIRYVLRSNPMQEWDRVTECNCSYCFKAGINNIFAPSSGVQWNDNNPKEATEYTIIHKDNAAVFCKTCGTHVFLRLPPDAPTIPINVRTLEDPEARGEMLDHEKVRARCKLVKYDMRSQPPLYEGRRHKIVDDSKL